MPQKTPKQARVRKPEKHKSFRLTKKLVKSQKSIPGLLGLIKQSIKALFGNKKLFFGIAAVYLLASLVFIQGLGSSFNIVSLKQEIEDLLGEQNSQVSTAFALLGYMFGSAGNQATGSSGAYQIFLFLIASLATIWGIRQVQAGEKPRLRDAFYKGMYPLVPFMAVLLVIGLQLLPFVIGNLLYTTVIQNGLAITALEKILWLLVFILLALLSIYMVISSLMAWYVVTLPEMTPLKALRSARELVMHRRLAVAVRILALPMLFLLLAVVIFVPVIIVATPLAQPLFLVLASVGLVYAHVYMYLLYRSLL